MSCSAGKPGYVGKRKTGESHSLCLIEELSTSLTFSFWASLCWIILNSLALDYHFYFDDSIFPQNRQFTTDLRSLTGISLKTQHLERVETEWYLHGFYYTSHHGIDSNIHKFLRITRFTQYFLAARSMEPLFILSPWIAPGRYHSPSTISCGLIRAASNGQEFTEGNGCDPTALYLNRVSSGLYLMNEHKTWTCKQW